MTLYPHAIQQYTGTTEVVDLLPVSPHIAERGERVCDPAVRTVGLSRSFGSVPALSDLNLSVPPGAIHGLVGPNGAGKTTALRLLLGLLCPSAGYCEVLGRNPATCGDEVRGRTGAVLEPCGLYDALNARENLDYFGRIWRLPDRERIARSQELLKAMGIWERRNENIGKWGRGLRQRLCIARSMMHRPALILMDEPNAGLDSSGIEEVSAYLKSLVATGGVTVLMATNNLTVVESICHSITVLNDGRVLASGHTAAVCRQALEPVLEIDGSGFTDEVLALLCRRPEVVSICRTGGGLSMRLVGQVNTAPLVCLLVESDVAISEVRQSQPSLRCAIEHLLQRDAIMVNGE